MSDVDMNELIGGLADLIHLSPDEEDELERALKSYWDYLAKSARQKNKQRRRKIRMWRRRTSR